MPFFGQAGKAKWMQLLVIRHAHPESDNPSPSTPLSNKGRQQAEHLVMSLADRGIMRIVSSPAARAVATVEPLAKALGLHVEVTADVWDSIDSLYDLIHDAADDDVILVCTHADVLARWVGAWSKYQGTGLGAGFPANTAGWSMNFKEQGRAPSCTYIHEALRDSFTVWTSGEGETVWIDEREVEAALFSGDGTAYKHGVFRTRDVPEQVLAGLKNGGRLLVRIYEDGNYPEFDVVDAGETITKPDAAGRGDGDWGPPLLNQGLI